MPALLASPSTPLRFTASGRLEVAPAPVLPLPLVAAVAGCYRVRTRPDGSALLLNAAGDVISPFTSVALAHQTLAFLNR